MKEYLGVLFGVCALSAIVRTVAPNGVMKKYIEIVCSLCVICAIASPVSQMFIDIYNIDDALGATDGELVDYDEIYNSYLLGNGLENAERALEGELESHFDCEAGSFEVLLGAELWEGEARLTSVAVVLGGEAVLQDPDEIKKYVLERLSTECEIIYRINDEK